MLKSSSAPSSMKTRSHAVPLSYGPNRLSSLYLAEYIFMCNVSLPGYTGMTSCSLQSPIRWGTLCEIELFQMSGALQPYIYKDRWLGGCERLYWEEVHFQVMYGIDAAVMCIDDTVGDIHTHTAQKNSKHTDALLLQGIRLLSRDTRPKSISRSTSTWPSVLITATKSRHWSKISSAAAPISLGSEEDLWNRPIYRSIILPCALKLHVLEVALCYLKRTVHYNM